jgi:hypothetical protein
MNDEQVQILADSIKDSLGGLVEGSSHASGLEALIMAIRGQGEFTDRNNLVSALDRMSDALNNIADSIRESNK